MRKELAKTYEPKSFEDRIYQFWLDGDYFKAQRDPNKTPYTIVIPPPNITGQLHMGHALDETLQDILIRYKKLQGFSALWVPGTDHASIATEAKIVAAMREEGVTKEELGREGFLERAWAWKEQYGGRIVSQLKKLGTACDWSRERFTLDEGCSEAVKEVFVRLYEKGLIYRGERIINWCPTCKTSISEAEVEYEAITDVLINDAAMVEKGLASARKITDFVEYDQKGMGGEDFAEYTKYVPGAFFSLGAGGTFPGHSDHYFVEEEAFKTGVAFYAQAALDFLAE